MKQLLSYGLKTFIAFFLISCNKDAIDNHSILGKWNILSDSTFFGVGMYNHPVNYTGTGGDYFDVRTDGNIYIKEGAVLDTLSYNLASDTTILIASFGIIVNGVPEISHITNLTAHSAIINTPLAITPGGVFGRKVSLKR